MSNWTILIIQGSAHLIDLDSKITEIDGFGSFPTKILQDYNLNEEFEIFDTKVKIVNSVQSETFKIMERRLLKAIMFPAMLVVFASGLIMIYINESLVYELYFQIKLILHY